MALPAVKTLQECGDISQTLLHFLPQLYNLPQQIFVSYSNLEEMKALYVDTNPAILSLAFALLLSPVFLIVSEINRNYSQVDRMWSILPTVYNAHYTLYAHMVGLPTLRMDTLLAFSAIWSARLTYNYWRKGGYSIGSEDYRWELLRQRISRPFFFLFNVAFISLAQSVLLWLITAPGYVLLLSSKLVNEDSTLHDVIFSRVLVGLVLLEWFADQQQWNFQEAKKFYQKTAKVPAKYSVEDLERGFVVSGLWSWSRHPNFAAEQAIWCVFYQWGCYVTDSLYNWTIVGAFGYLLLFQASTWFTELVTAGKYPEYAEYQQRVGKFIPRMSTELPGEPADISPQASKDERRGKPTKVE